MQKRRRSNVVQLALPSDLASRLGVLFADWRVLTLTFYFYEISTCGRMFLDKRRTTAKGNGYSVTEEVSQLEMPLLWAALEELAKTLKLPQESVWRLDLGRTGWVRFVTYPDAQQSMDLRRPKTVRGRWRQKPGSIPTDGKDHGSDV